MDVTSASATFGTRSRRAATRFRSRSEPEVCICGQLIPETAVYYGFPLSEDNDAPMAFISEWHDHCLKEWGWRRDNSEWGIEHVPCATGDAEAVRGWQM